MTNLQMGLALGLMTAGLGVFALRIPILAWVALVPLGVAIARLPPGVAAIAAAISATAITAPSFPTRTLRPLLVLGTAISAASWAGAAAFISALWPADEPAWAVLTIPLFAVLSVLPLRAAGAPRTATNPLARTQELWLPVVHIARLGSDLFVTAALGMSAGIATLIELEGIHGLSKSVTFIALTIAGLTLVSVLAFGLFSYGNTRRRSAMRRKLRVAAVVCDGAAPDDRHDGFWPLHSAEYADVQSTIDRYEGHVSAAIAAGAQILVLPEVAVRVGTSSREEWVGAACAWAKRNGVVVVAPYFDDDRSRNELVIVGPSGVLVRYEKQHGAPTEPKRRERMPPGHALIDASTESLSISTVICVDLDYSDLVRPVARVGGLLAVPANDWPGYEVLHHRAAVWSAVMSGTSVLRATGHGISAAYDPSGHVIAQCSSLSGRRPVVLVAEVPI